LAAVKPQGVPCEEGAQAVTEQEITAIGWSGPGAPAHPRFPVTQGLSGAAVATKRAVVVNDVTADPRRMITTTQASASQNATQAPRRSVHQRSLPNPLNQPWVRATTHRRPAWIGAGTSREAIWPVIPHRASSSRHGRWS
jgi:hypothetical protein